jgi:hypothetical protein
MRGAADVGAGEDLRVEVGGGQLLERQLQDLEMVGGGVRARVPRPQDGGQRLAGLVQIAAQRVKAETAFVVAGRLLLLGVGTEQGRVEVQGDRLRSCARVPGPRPRRSAGTAHPIEDHRIGQLDHPMRGRLRGDRPEQRLLPAQDTEVADAVAAVGDRDAKVAQHATGVVGRAALAGRRQRL